MNFNFIDAFFQLGMFLLLFAIIGIIVYFVLSSKKNNKRLDMLEQKVNNISNQLNKNNTYS